MATEYVISIKVQGQDRASGPLGAVGGALGRISELVSAGVIFSGLTKITDGLNDAARAGFNAATGFETVFSRIKGLTDTAAVDIPGMSADVLKLSKETDKSAKGLAEAMYFIASSGYAGREAFDVLQPSARAAAAGLGETKTIADAVTSALNAYKLQAKDAARITDILTTAVKMGKGEPDALAGALGRVLPIAAASGVGMEEVAASLSTMTLTGLSAEEAATALRGTLGALLAPGKQARDALAEIGWSVDELKKSIRERGLNATLADMMQRTQGNVETLDLIIPNVRALTGVLSSAASQGDTYAATLAAMYQAQGSTDKAFAESSKTWEFQWERFKNVLTAVPIEIGQTTLPQLTGTLNSITAEVNKWAEPFAAQITSWLTPIFDRLQRATAEGGIPGLINEIGKLISEGWTNVIWPNLKKWANEFWQWVTGANGAQAQVPGTMDKLLASIQTWSNDPTTQAQLAQFGDSAGRGLVKGVEGLVGQVETWTPILTKMGSALAEALPGVALNVGGAFGAYFLKGVAEQLGMEKQFQSGLQGLMNIKSATQQAGGAINQVRGAANTAVTIYGGVQNFAQGGLAGLLAGLVP